MFDTADRERPWDQPWTSRRDCASHRGPLLGCLAGACVCCAAVTVSLIGLIVAYRFMHSLAGTTTLSFGFFAMFPLLPSFVGLVLGIVTVVLARRDLKLMQAGLKDARGREQTERALWRLAFAGAVINLVSFLGLLTAVVLS